MPDRSQLTLGVDIGTYETKGALLAAGQIVVASAARPNQVITGDGGRVEHDAERTWWDGTVEIVRDLLGRPGVTPTKVEAIAVSGIGPCVLPTTRQWQPLGGGSLYGLDTRATREITELTQRFGTSSLLRRCGNTLSSQSAGPKIWWWRRHQPQIHAQAELFLTSQSFVVARLTGRAVIDHLTASYFHPLYDQRTQAWNLEGCEDFVRIDQLPEIAWSGAIAGTLTADAAQQTGLVAGLPVLVGTADAPAEALAAGVTSPGDTMIMYGSSSFMLQLSPRPVADGRVWSAPYLFEGTHLAAAGTSTAGTLTRWIADMMGICGQDAEVFATFAGLAAQSPPGANGLLMLPYPNGERTPLNDPGARGVMAGFSLTHGRADLARAAVEGIAHSMTAALHTLEDVAGPARRALAVGGGTRNFVWTQAVSDISGSNQQLMSDAGAATGDAKLAALTVGIITGPAELSHQVHPIATVHPHPQLREMYRRDQQRFRALYERTRDLVHASPPDPGDAQ